MSDKKLKVTLTRSAIGYTERQKRTVRALGLRKMDQSVLHDDTPAVRGMIAKVGHLVSVEEVENDETA
ncbi:MAG: 50S ribosomal protein L30 [Anaerolineae bacterium]|nr:50S ribosomal protein L30 [Anaerolineae bacterium]